MEEAFNNMKIDVLKTLYYYKKNMIINRKSDMVCHKKDTLELIKKVLERRGVTV